MFNGTEREVYDEDHRSQGNVNNSPTSQGNIMLMEGSKQHTLTEGSNQHMHTNRKVLNN